MSCGAQRHLGNQLFVSQSFPPKAADRFFNLFHRIQLADIRATSKLIKIFLKMFSRHFVTGSGVTPLEQCSKGFNAVCVGFSFHILAECANAAWRRVSGGTVPKEQAHAFLEALPQWFESLVPSVRLHETAFEMACVLGYPGYDCQYLALAEKEEMRMVTADSVFVDRVRSSPWKNRIESLGGD